MRALAALPIALALSACMTPDTARPMTDADAVRAERDVLAERAVRFQDAQARRLHAIAWPIMTANAELCPRRAYMPGFRLTSHYEYPRDLRSAARAHLGVDYRPTIAQVLPASPAAASGLRQGDRVEAIDGRRTGPGARDWRRAVRRLQRSARDGRVALSLTRGEARLEYEIALTPACGYAFEVMASPMVNAFADGERIVLMEGLIDFAETDAEIAFVFAHELAHNAERHINDMQWNAISVGAAGLALDVAFASLGLNTGGVLTEAGMRAGWAIHSPAYEAEADYISLYYLARAGLSMDGVEDFWRRMSDRDPHGVTHATTHPSYPERTLSLIAARQEIRAKIEAGEPLIPEREGRERARTRWRIDG